MQWQFCQFSMYFFQFNQNSTIYTDLTVIQHLQCQYQPFVSYLLAEDPGPSIPNIAAILPDFDGFVPILSKLNYLYRYNRHPTLQYQNLPFVSHRLAEDQGRPIPVQWQYCQFAMYFFQFNHSSTIYTDLIATRHLQCQNQAFVSYLLAEDPGPSIPNIVAILPYFDGFLPILSKLNHLYRWNRHPTLQCQN